MNDLKPFEYCLLKYCPSYALGEQVNVGIFFFFKEELTLKFFFPEALSRLNSLFPATNINVLRTYFKNIQNKIKALSKDKELLKKSTLDDLHKLVLTPDSSSLFFERVRTSQYNTINNAITYYEKSYFDVYKHKTEEGKHSDQYLVKKFAEKIGQHRDFSALFKREFRVTNKSGISAKFDFAWQNGHINLIKPLSFDLMHPSSIQDKSVKWFGFVAQLEETAKNNNLVFNFLVAKPTDKNLFESFEESISILEDKTGLVELVDEENLDKYLEEARETIKPLEYNGF